MAIDEVVPVRFVDQDIEKITTPKVGLSYIHFHLSNDHIALNFVVKGNNASFDKYFKWKILDRNVQLLKISYGDNDSLFVDYAYDKNMSSEIPTKFDMSNSSSLPQHKLLYIPHTKQIYFNKDERNKKEILTVRLIDIQNKSKCGGPLLCITTQDETYCAPVNKNSTLMQIRFKEKEHVLFRFIDWWESNDNKDNNSSNYLLWYFVLSCWGLALAWHLWEKNYI